MYRMRPRSAARYSHSEQANSAHTMCGVTFSYRNGTVAMSTITVGIMKMYIAKHKLQNPDKYSGSYLEVETMCSAVKAI